MPQIPQEPLSPLVCTLNVTINITDAPPPSYGIQIQPHLIHTGGLMTYLGNHGWQFIAQESAIDWIDRIAYGTLVTIPCNVYVGCYLDWPYDHIALITSADPFQPHHLESGYASTILHGCERGSPWHLPWTSMPIYSGPHTFNVTIRRDISPLAPLLHSLANSPTVHGTLGDWSVVTGPVYPDGAIYGVTPPDKTLTYMRRKAQRDFTTHPALLTRQEAFTSAATQWNALTAPQQAHWTAAGKTCRPRVAGYALFTEILSTKRLDLMSLLETRTGLSLIPPVYPT